MADPLAARRKRLMFQSLRRGTREGDFIIGGFARRHLDSLDAGQLEKFDSLLACNEPDLLAWITGVEPVPPEHDHPVMALLVEFKNSLASN
jgi:antitoxin CptB